MSKIFNESERYINPNAMMSADSKGREKKIKGNGYRTEFQRDVHRILYSQPFRRLRHKTQVFFLPLNDHICTRMEHVLHVASASISVARHLRFNEDLTEAIGLGHDIGHAPFGHHGEQVLNEIAQENNLSIIFEHEIYGLRVVDMLAELDREPEAGLNLTFEVRDGIISHCGEDHDREVKPDSSKDKKSILTVKSKKEVGSPATFEAAIVRMVDKIIYAGRDIEDAIRAGLLKENEIPAEVASELGENNGEIVDNLITDLIEYSKNNPDCIGLTIEKHQALDELIKFNYNEIYRHDLVEKYKKQATLALKQLYCKLVEDLENTDRLTRGMKALPNSQVYKIFSDFINKIGYHDDESNRLIALDFIAGMTDNFVIHCLNELYVPKQIA